MDPLSDVLSLLKPRSYGCGGFDMGEETCIGFPRHDGIKCYAVVSGACWLVVEGEPAPVQLKAGDCFVLPSGPPFRLASDLALPPVDFRILFEGRAQGGFGALNGGGGCTIVGGHFALDDKHADILLSALPVIVHIHADADKAALRFSLERMMQELRAPQPGGHLVIEHLAQMMMVQALRLHMADDATGRVGWLFALADKQIGTAIGAMHAEPARRWTLETLATHSGMSRTSFAVKFKRMVGEPVMEYLTRWRMLCAADRLANGSDPVSNIALSLGYESESAFSAAFRRVMGKSPRACRGEGTESKARGVAPRTLLGPGDPDPYVLAHSAR
jgi:AraC-like DNA-binding protein